MTDPSNSKPHRIDLALQGGGSHGAFTWGVLDRLLDEPALEFNGISGTSAGALNAAVVATGHAKGGRDGARAALREFWLDVSRAGRIFSPLSPQQLSALDSQFSFEQLPAWQWANSFFHSLSPYDVNPLNLNPLRDVVRRHVDEAALRDCALPLFITATSVKTGQARVFTRKDVTVDALMASACLPFMFQAVQIDGEAYWDGGYSGNPALYPLIYNTPALDIVLVKINPLMRAELPKRSDDIMDRLSEITFNATLIAEMRAISFVQKLLREDRLEPGRYKDLRLHMIADDKGLAPFHASSKTNTERSFLEDLFKLGHTAADAWLHRHGKDVGVKSTLDIDREFLGKR